MSEISGQKEKYGKLLVVALDGSTADFNFTKTKFAAFEKIVDELTRLDYKFVVHDRVTRRTMIYTEEIVDNFEIFSGYVQMFNDARKRSRNCGVDVLMFQASEKQALFYQVDGMDDFDEYCLVFDESDLVPTSPGSNLPLDRGSNLKKFEGDGKEEELKQDLSRAGLKREESFDELRLD